MECEEKGGGRSLEKPDFSALILFCLIFKGGNAQFGVH